MIEMSLGNLVMMVTIVGAVGPLGVWLGSLRQKVLGHDDRLDRIDNKIDEIYKYVKNGRS